ncbi:hypothetical protein V2S66_33125 [Streptomyces sp. V4-01]|uniref:Secreted protein n=1 Tax=Actinacidiphila polyblastidii TaxID=3110430 RepID=A0ABU7PLT3_9ACTN|nr:hypothetical protein [Streptomyces sp. V4-01]
MPRGRHRHSQPLHRMLPPLTVAASAAALAVAALFAGDTAALRGLVVAAALTAGAGAALARRWDRSAGRSVAELNAARVRDEWHADERIAEIETDLEESREIRGRLEKKLRSKRAELARLRTEHAELLRRYATAESERARALEARRRLQLEGNAAQARLEITSGPAPVGAAAYLRAAQALRDLPRNAARQQAQRTVEEARRREAAAAEERQGRHASGAPAALPVREPRLVPAVAAAVLPYAQRPSGHPAGHRAIGGFDFFGTQRAAGDEQGREHGHEGQGGHGAAHEAGPEGGRPESPVPLAADAEVIDLTAHDETEQLDVTELRAQA